MKLSLSRNPQLSRMEHGTFCGRNMNFGFPSTGRMQLLLSARLANDNDKVHKALAVFFLLLLLLLLCDERKTKKKMIGILFHHMELQDAILYNWAL